ncbi:thermostable alpha-amylase [Exidia glandulosa HHB12029]|uniref:alpha-amylase n=1 Tax=Exidia glandulosa HHB12029 TaxID=1314781 RepID=A0A165GHZ1_EXIGL|nr:thermostable alpha-amylase [Exidia glandulosa HHB12029]
MWPLQWSNSFLERLAKKRAPPEALKSMYLGPTGSNPVMLQFFEWNSKGPSPDVSWWNFFRQQLPSIAEHGVTLVWLPPPNKGMNKEGRGYDAYDLWDLGEFDQKGTIATRWGTKDELLEATRAAQDLDVGILVDAVLNHKMGADRAETVSAVPVSPQDRRREIGRARDITASVDYNGRGTGVFRFRDKKWSPFVDKELGNYDYLLGQSSRIDHTDPEVRNDLLSWGPWVLNTTLARGFRLDAIKHFDYTFTRDFLKHCRASVAQNLFAVGEYWSPNARVLEDKLHIFDGTLALFDVALHQTFHLASKQGSAFDLRTILRSSLVERCPWDAVTFVDNHDHDTGPSQQPGQMLESWVDSKFKLIAYALILLRPAGLPCVFYGDIYPDGRNYEENTSKGVLQLMSARKTYAYGPVRDFFSSRNCIGFVRDGDAQHSGCAVVLCNDARRSRKGHTCVMQVGKARAGEQYRLLFGESLAGVDAIIVAANGQAEFRSAGQVAIWVPASSADGS